VIGDLPYGDEQLADIENLRKHITADPEVHLVVHVGDIKTGATPCDAGYYQTIRSWFDGFTVPLVYTPGDNEWTDCHRASAGGHDPLDRLELVRKVFFPRPGHALGAGERELTTQAELAGFEPFVENVRWLDAGVVFLTVHVVGSNNGLVPWSNDAPARRETEVQRRSAAAIDWLERGFALGREQGAAGMVVFMHADTWLAGAGSGFDTVLKSLSTLAAAYARPTLLIQGDSHSYLTDRPIAEASKLTRIVVQGDTTHEWLKVAYDRSRPDVFFATRVAR
jgi:hypothetical protein